MPTPKPDLTPRSAGELFTILDWIGVALTFLTGAAVGVTSIIIAPVFEGMFKDLGAATLPPMTRLALTPWFGPVLSATPLLMAVAALRADGRSLGQRRALVVIAFLLVLVAAALVVWGLYQPIFQLAGNVRSDL